MATAGLNKKIDDTWRGEPIESRLVPRSRIAVALIIVVTRHIGVGKAIEIVTGVSCARQIRRGRHMGRLAAKKPHCYCIDQCHH